MPSFASSASAASASSVSSTSVLLRANVATPWIVKPDPDPCWNEGDWGRSAILEARWVALGVSEQERRQLLPCAVWKAKFPGLVYTPAIEARIRSLAA